YCLRGQIALQSSNKPICPLRWNELLGLSVSGHSDGLNVLLNTCYNTGSVFGPVYVLYNGLFSHSCFLVQMQAFLHGRSWRSSRNLPIQVTISTLRPPYRQDLYFAKRG